MVYDTSESVSATRLRKSHAFFFSAKTKFLSLTRGAPAMLGDGKLQIANSFSNFSIEGTEWTSADAEEAWRRALTISETRGVVFEKN
jgi:hypothetical protein